MNRNDFVNMIENVSQVDSQMIREVYELIDMFPYFQSAHMLLLKGLLSSGDVKFESQLRNSAIHISDREVLYYLLKSKTTARTEENVIDQRDLSQDQSQDNQQTVIESAKNSEDLISEIERNFEKIQVDKQENIDGLPGHSILVSYESENKESEGVVFLVDEDQTPVDENVFYMDPGFSLPENTDLLELDLDISETGSYEEEISLEEEFSSEENEPIPLSQSELIDKFIISNPRIEAVKEPLRTPVVDISKPYTELEGGFVTETLAKIYINQEYYSKAIDIYEKLCLKFPEKSSYFASQIEIVKEYLKK